MKIQKTYKILGIKSNNLLSFLDSRAVMPIFATKNKPHKNRNIMIERV